MLHWSSYWTAGKLEQKWKQSRARFAVVAKRQCGQAGKLNWKPRILLFLLPPERVGRQLLSPLHTQPLLQQLWRTLQARHCMGCACCRNSWSLSCFQRGQFVASGTDMVFLRQKLALLPLASPISLFTLLHSQPPRSSCNLKSTSAKSPCKVVFAPSPFPILAVAAMTAFPRVSLLPPWHIHSCFSSS